MLKQILVSLVISAGLAMSGCADTAPETEVADAAVPEIDPQSPQAFLNELYGHYADQGPGAGIDLAAPGIIERYFTPSLAQAIMADAEAAKAANEVPRLDGNPFLGSQDWQVSELGIAVAKSADPDRTQAFVRFKNYDQPTEVKLELQRGVAGWQIADIDWGYAILSQILQE